MTHVRSTRFAAACLALLGFLVAAEWRPRAAGTISGVVFEDFNGNGLRDTTTTVPNGGGASGATALAIDRGVAGVTVSAYDTAGALQGTAVSDAAGAYSLVAAGTGPYRIEFTALPTGYRPSAHGLGATGSGTTVQFVPDGNSTNINFGIIDPASFCQNNPTIYTSCFVYGDNVAGANNTMPVVVDFPYAAGANTGTPADYFLPNSHGLMVPANGLGAVFGLGFHRPTSRIFAAAFMKKHAGYGPEGPGAIYSIDPATQPGGAPSLYVNLDTLFGAGTTGGDAHAGNGGDYDRDAGNVTWDAVGKTSLGGLEVSPDGQFLFVVNLADRQVYRLPATVAPTVGNTVRTAMPVPATAVPADGSDLRPFALQYHRGLLYVGMVNSAESTALATNLRAYVYTLDPATMTFGATPVLEFALNYPRGAVQTFAGTTPATWRPWRPTFGLAPGGGSTVGAYPQPMLTGLSFDADGNMTLGLRDRAGDQFGFFTFDNPGNSTRYEGVAGGDTLFAQINTPGNLASGWTLESNAATSRFGPTGGANNNQGPGNGEYYFADEYAGTHQELSGGTLLQLPGFPDVVSSAFDPGLTVRTGGFIWLRNANGSRSKGYNLYDTGFVAPPAPTFSKANGFGEMVQICEAAPIEIGNRVWDDLDGDGVQDPNEPGIDGVAVQLVAPGGGVLATAVTANGGQYYFSSSAGTNAVNAIYSVAGLTASTAGFRVRIDTTQAVFGSRVLTVANGDATANGDSRDSDGTLVSTNAEVVFGTGAAGDNDHTYDFGFTSATPTLNLGDLLWYDTNDNGVVDGGEQPIAGVDVVLYRDNGDGLFDATTDTFVATQATSGSGLYNFTGLAAGNYFVQVAAAEFGVGQPLNGYRNSSGQTAGDTNDADHGAAAPVSGQGIVSDLVTLSLGGEPTNDGDGNNGNLTIDFGFYRLSLGNLVFIDADNSGTFNAGDTPRDGVTVELLDAGNAVVATTVTAGGGLYQFSGLAPGDYRVRITPPAGFTSSTGGGSEPAGDPDNNADNTDDGTISGPTSIVSLPITLTPGAEPTITAATGTTANTTVDFGLIPATLSLGNLVWLDTNNNGLVDGGEAGIAGVTVRLIAANGTTVLATTTTNGSGNYLFTGLAAGTYFVEVDRGSGPIVGYLSSTDIASSANPDNDTDNDDNGVNVTATTVRSNAVTLSLNSEPVNDGDTDPNSNLSVDFGFVRALSLGNLVWSDLNDNGVADPGEPGLSGVTVRLIAADGVTVLATTTTDATGHYLFPGLGPGTYFVEVVPPAGSTSSTDIGSSANPNNDVDNDDNGVTVVGGAVRSGPVTLGIGTEPTTDGDGNPDSNLTVDFGFVPAGVLSLGNLVWLDTNNNGLVDGGEAGVPGATVRLIAANGTTVLATTTTNGSGNYLFTGLAAGTYFVEVDRATGPLTGYLSSTDIASSANPNNDLDNDDNGVTVTATTVRSGAVTLSVLGEPTNDGDTDANSNLSVDFGFVRAVSLGNLVWADSNDNGLVDPGETGIGGVTVRLIASDGVTVLATTTTDAAGHYLFAGLAPGTYYVEVVPPAGATSSTDIASSANPNNDTDNDDNGVTVVAGAVRSGAITLGFGTEPVNDGDTNPDSNLSVDFGFVPAPGGGFLTDICLQQVVPATVLPGGQMVVTYTATNRGPGAAVDLVIDGMLPPGVTVASTSPSAGGVCTVTSGMLECRWLGFTPANGTRQVNVIFQVSPSIPVGTPVALWFMTSSNNTDPYPACNMVDAYVFVGGGSTSADLAVSSIASGAGGAGTAVAAAVGQPLPARFTVSNPSAVPARGTYVLLLDEAGLVDVSSATWSPQGWVTATNATSATWETGPIPPGGSATLDLTLVPRTAAATRLQLVRVDGQPADPNAANDQVDLLIDGVGSGGGRWVAAGNLDGAGVDEIVTGAGLGETPQVRVFSSAGAPLASFYAFDRAFRGGVRVASCDVNNDGFAELVAAQGPGGGRVRVLSIAGGVVNDLVAFDAFEPSFTGGVNVACGDVDGDGRAEVVVGPDGGRAPDVKVFSVGALTATVVAQFQAYEPTFTGGVRVTAARFAGSPLVGGFNVATAPGPGRAGDIRVWSVIGGTSSLVASAPLTASTAGAQLLLADIDGDASLDLLIAPDNGAPSLVQVFRLATGALMLDAGPGAGGFRSVRPAVGHFGGAPELIVGHGAGEAPGVLTLSVGGGVGVRLAFTSLEQP